MKTRTMYILLTFMVVAISILDFQKNGLQSVLTWWFGTALGIFLGWFFLGRKKKNTST